MGWEDIEEMPTINLREELLALLNKELEYALPPPDGSDGTSSASNDDDESLDAVRRNVCQWNYECVDYFLFDREVVYISMHYFDRYLARQAEKERANKPSVVLSHLLALSCLYVACKLHGATTDSSLSHKSSEGDVVSTGGQRRIRLEDFCQMSRGTYCPQMLEEMELSLLSNLQWKLHPPTPTDFLIRFVKILSLLFKGDIYGQSISSTETVGKGWSVFEVARYQIELAVYSPELCHQLPSKIALAALLNAMDSKVVRTKRTIISSHIRDNFLQHLKCLGGGFTQLNVEGDDMVDARTTLKKLCSKTIVLPGQIVDDQPPSNEVTFMPITDEARSFEYELPEVKSLSGPSISPVCVNTDCF